MVVHAWIIHNIMMNFYYIYTSMQLTVQPKIFKGENVQEFRGFLTGLENFALENLGPSKSPLKIYFQSRWFKITVQAVMNILNAHYLWTCKP